MQIPASVISSVGTTSNYHQSFAGVPSRRVLPSSGPSQQHNRLISNECVAVGNETATSLDVQYVDMVLQQQQQQQKEMATDSDQYGGAGNSTYTGSAGANGGSTAPMLHPKKRKYDPAEAEQFATDLSQQPPNSAETYEPSVRYSPGRVSAMSVDVMVSSSAGVVKTTTDTSAMEQQGQDEPRQCQVHPMPELDLRDWCETRVLAKYKKGESVYVQGVIKASDVATELLVEFEGPDGGLRQTYDVINDNRFDIIADASPSISDVSKIGCTSLLVGQLLTPLRPLVGQDRQSSVCADADPGPGRVRICGGHGPGH